MIIWRGMGIAIPIIFIISSLLYQLIAGDPDSRLGNSTMLGWGSLATGIITLLLSVAISGASKDAQGNPIPKKKHDLFWIPMWIWGIAFIGFCIYFLVFKKDPKTSPPPNNLTEETQPEPKAATRVVHFFNASADSMKFLVGDGPKDEVILDDLIAPKTIATRKIKEGYYLFSMLNTAGDLISRLPLDEDHVDEKSYKKYPNEDGSFYYQRLLRPATPEPDDYDEAWVIMDGKTKLLLVDVSMACDSEVTRGAIRKHKWLEEIEEEYGPGDLIEPLAGMRLKDGNINVYGPVDKLPFQAEPGDKSYLLVPYQGEKDKNKLISEHVEWGCFDD